MKHVRKRHTLGAFILVLFCFLVLAAVLIARQQRSLLRDDAFHQAEHDLELMADASLETLLKSDFATVRTFVERWGQTHGEFHEIRAVAPNGFTLAEYRNPSPTAGEFYSMSKEVAIGNRKLATIYLVGDFHDSDTIAAHLRNRLIVGAFIITSLLGAAVWIIFRKMAMAPLEEAVEERTRALSVALQELEQEMAERQGAQEKLRAREEHISLVLNSIAEGIYGVDLQGNCTFINPAALRILGYEHKEDVLDKNMHQLIHHTRPDGSYFASSDCTICRCYRTGKGSHVDDEVFWRPDNTVLPIEYRAQPIMDNDHPIGAVVAFVDVSERKKSEAELKGSQKKFQAMSSQFTALLDAIPDSITLISRDYKILWANRTAGGRVNREAHALEGEDCYRLWFDRSLPCEECSVRESFRTGMPSASEVIWKDRKLEVRAVPILGPDGVINVIRVGRDMTDQQKLQDQLRQAQKMESVGTLAGGIAHDFNNILTAIIGYGNIALMKLEDAHPQRQNIRHILTAADRATYLTQGLLAFSRKKMSNKKQVDLNDLMKKTENFLRRIIGEDIEFLTNLHAGPLMVFADPNQIEQVLMNLATNARDAMPKGGVLTVAIESIHLGEEFLTQHGFGKPGFYGMITVSDTGIGMSEEIQKRMFEPFFTTKDVGQGTGLGLSIIYGIVKQHQGFITVDSKRDKGTTFRMYLPVIESQAIAGAEAEEAGYPAKGTETILLAEDEEALRELMRSVFEEFGYDVITAVDGDDAVKKFAAHKDRIHLFLSDLIMPKMNGKEAYDEIRKMRPDIKAIFASGYSPDIVRDKTDLGSGATIIYKPVSPMELLKKVRSVLDEAGD